MKRKTKSCQRSAGPLDRRTDRRIRFESLEARTVLSASSFVETPLATLEGRFETVVVADMDADGDQDIIASTDDGNEATEERILWYEARDGQYVERSLPMAQLESTALIATDVDGDGDLDILVGIRTPQDSIEFQILRQRTSVEWFENTDGLGTFAERKRIGVCTECVVRGFHPIDFDRDGDQDLLFTAIHGTGFGGNLALLRNEGSGQFELIPIGGGAFVQAVDIYDFDNDGDLDVFAGFGSDTNFTLLGWYERTADDTFEFHEVHREVAWSEAVVLVDFDADGDKDILTAGEFALGEDPNRPTGWGYRIAWRENLDGAGSFSEAIVFKDNASAYSMHADDFDQDGRLDLIMDTVDGLVLYTGTGPGEFAEREIIDDLRGRDTADVDHDGDLDLIYTTFFRDEFARIMWTVGYLDNRLAGDVNNDNEVTFADFLVLSENFGQSVEAWSSGDLDGDGNVSFADFLVLSEHFGRTRP